MVSLYFVFRPTWHYTTYSLLKNGDLSVTSISASMFRHVPISSARLNASLYLNNISIAFIFSSLTKHELIRLMYFSDVSLLVMCFLSSSGSNHGYLSVDDFCFLSNFNVFTKLLKYSQSFLTSQIYPV